MQYVSNTHHQYSLSIFTINLRHTTMSASFRFTFREQELYLERHCCCCKKSLKVFSSITLYSRTIFSLVMQHVAFEPSNCEGTTLMTPQENYLTNRTALFISKIYNIISISTKIAVPCKNLGEADNFLLQDGWVLRERGLVKFLPYG